MVFNKREVVFDTRRRTIPADVSQHPSVIQPGDSRSDEIISADTRAEILLSRKMEVRGRSRLEGFDTGDESVANWQDRVRRDQMQSLLTRQRDRI